MSNSKLQAKLAQFIFPQYEHYAPQVLNNSLKRIFLPKKGHKFLFILSPPFCGSTLLNELISTSRSVSVNNNLGSREGQTLPTVKGIMFDHQHRWNASHDFDWEKIKKEWMKYWDVNYPVLLEKSPPNLIRAQSISKVFSPAWFIVFYRNPYAHCESLIRRNGVAPQEAANFAIMGLRYQRENTKNLEKAIPISYELLTTKPLEVVGLLAGQIPELSDLDVNRTFSAHNFQNKDLEIQNLNEAKIRKLSADQIAAINTVFLQERELLDYFGYELLNIN